MEENRNINNTSETGVVEDSQQPKQEENWKEAVKKDWKEAMGEFKSGVTDNPDMPKSKSGKVAVCLLSFVVLVGVIAVACFVGKRAIYTIGSEFFFLQPSDEEFLRYANNCIHENYSYDIDLSFEQVEMHPTDKYKGTCPGSSEEESDHYGCLVSITDESVLDKIRQILDDPTIISVDFDIAVGEGHVYAKPIALTYNPDEAKDREFLDEIEDAFDDIAESSYDDIYNGDAPDLDDTYYNNDEYDKSETDDDSQFYYATDDVISAVKGNLEETMLNDLGYVLKFPNYENDICLYMGDIQETHYKIDCPESDHGFYYTQFEVLNEELPEDPMGMIMIVAFCDDTMHVIDAWEYYFNEDGQLDAYKSAVAAAYELYGDRDARRLKALGESEY